MSFYPAVRQKSFGDLDALRSTARPPTSPAIAALMRPTKSSMMALYISDRSYTGQRWPLRDEMWIQTVKQERRALSKMPPGCTLKSKDYIKAPEPTPQQRASPAAIASASAPRAHWQRERMFDSRGQRSSGAGFNTGTSPRPTARGTYGRRRLGSTRDRARWPPTLCHGRRRRRRYSSIARRSSGRRATGPRATGPRRVRAAARRGCRAGRSRRRSACTGRGG